MVLPGQFRILKLKFLKLIHSVNQMSRSRFLITPISRPFYQFSCQLPVHFHTELHRVLNWYAIVFKEY